MAKVSVIIPTHNRPEYLPTAIRSVLGQTYQDFEIIVVDDASTDETLEIVGSFDDERLRYLRLETSSGAAAARNKGIEKSAAEYLAFLDDDDEWLPDKLRLQVEKIENSAAHVGMVYTGYLAVERSTGQVIDIRRPTQRGDLYHALLKDNWVSSTSSVLMKRECVQKIGMFDETLPSFQDYDLWIRISKHFRIECVSEPLFRFYCHGQRIWTDLEALRAGMELMLSKYGDSRIVRKQFSHRYLYLGVRYCEAGDIRKGRTAFLRAVRLHALEPRHYFNLALSFAGPKHFRCIREGKDKLLDPLRGELARISGERR
jgi:glycosyltransferase involved in cell wall biosynthesis